VTVSWRYALPSSLRLNVPRLLRIALYLTSARSSSLFSWGSRSPRNISDFSASAALRLMFWSTYSAPILFRIAEVNAGFLPWRAAPMMPLCFPFSSIFKSSWRFSNVFSSEFRTSENAVPAFPLSSVTRSLISPTCWFTRRGSPTLPSSGLSRSLCSSRKRPPPSNVSRNFSPSRLAGTSKVATLMASVPHTNPPIPNSPGSDSRFERLASHSPTTGKYRGLASM
jgi:hypothetical protein